MKTATTARDPHPQAGSPQASFPGVPDGHSPREDARAMQALLGWVQARVSRPCRLVGVVSPPLEGTSEQYHLLFGGLAIALGAINRSIDLTSGVYEQLIPGVLCISACIFALQGRGMFLSPKEPAFSLLLQEDPKKRPERVIFGFLDHPPPPRQHRQLRWGILAALLAIACVLPSIGLAWWGATLCAAGWLGVTIERWLRRSKQGNVKVLEGLLSCAKNAAPGSWVVCSCRGEAGIISVLDWWNLQNIELIWLQDEPRELHRITPTRTLLLAELGRPNPASAAEGQRPV